jgi:serine/threonine protein kinase/ABC-type branched-subunit amino acid transport system substrate-binding protein
VWVITQHDRWRRQYYLVAGLQAMPDDAHIDRDGGTPRPPTAQPVTVDGLPPATPLVRLGPFRIVESLGEGGMGRVYRAEDSLLGREVALKVMKPELVCQRPARQRFLREARAVAALQHDHIVPILQVGEDQDVPYIVMPLLAGESLTRRLEREPRFPCREVLRIGRETAEGLAAAHEKGLVHRDIKPGNLWLEAPTGRVKILDFGLVRAETESEGITREGVLLGSPGYMSPEQVNGQAVDPRTDLFSLGCVLYRMATGKSPFTGDNMMAVLRATAEHEPPPAHTCHPHVPQPLSVLIGQLLEKRPQDRPASARIVADSLREMEQLGEAPTTDGPAALLSTSPSLSEGPREQLRLDKAVPGSGSHPSARRVWMVGVISFMLLGCVLGIWFLTQRTSGNPLLPSLVTVQGVSDERILFGMTGPFTGSTAELGRHLEAGIRTCFRRVNDEGGIAGRQLELVALDDGYEPDRALANMQRLDEEYKVFACIGNVGTPTAQVTLPYALKRKMLLFGAFSGGDLLRRVPPDRHVFNYRPSLEEETAAAVNYLIRRKKVRPDRIAVFSQDDEYGAAGFRGVEKALRRHGLAPEQIVHVRYPRNTVRIEAAEKEILSRRQIEAVVLVATYKPAARFIRQIRRTGRQMLFTSTAFSDAAALADELRGAAPEFMEGVSVTQTVPPVDSHASLVLTYREQLRRYAPSEAPTAVSLEGYIAAAILCEGLRRAGADLTTETLVEALESIRDLDLGLGPRINFGPSEHQAIHKVWGLVLDRSGRYRPLELD